MKLPYEIRESLVLSLDEWLENVNDDPGPEDLAGYVVEALETAAEETELEELEDIVSMLEEDLELDEPLVDHLEYEFGRNDDLELSGDEVVAYVEKVLRLKWSKTADLMDELEEFDALDDDDEEDEDD